MNKTFVAGKFFPSFSNKSHNSALVTGSDEDGLIIQPTMVEQYEL